MIKHCRSCGTEYAGVGTLCALCSQKVKAQNERTGLKLRHPITVCQIDGCNEEATETTLCLKHSKQLIENTSDLCKTHKCKQTAEINGYCLKHFGALNIKAIDLEPKKDLKVESNIDSNVDCQDKLLPEFIRNQDIVAKNADIERCSSRYECMNPVYKEGLCATHYKLKYDKGSCHEVVQEPTKLVVPTAKSEEKLVLNQCLTSGCSRPATHGNLCLKCYNTSLLERNSKLREKIIRLRAGH